MKARARINNISVPFGKKGTVLTLDVEAAPENLEPLQNEELDLEIKKHRKHRSLDANALLWACLGDMAPVLEIDNWSLYLHELSRYGKFTYILVRPEAAEAVKKQWREVREVGDPVRVLNKRTGKYEKMLQMQCFYGSSTYDSKEMSVLLNGVIDDMKSLGLPPPPSGDMKRAIEALERRELDKAGRSAQEGQGSKA